MPHLVFAAEVQEDLESLAKVSVALRKRIGALLIELKGDEDLLDRLTQHGYGADKGANFDIGKWVTEHIEGRNLWRLKFWELENKGLKYRVVYSFEPQLKRLAVLGVVNRDLFDYDDESNELANRIRNAYDRIHGVD